MGLPSPLMQCMVWARHTPPLWHLSAVSPSKSRRSPAPPPPPRSLTYIQHLCPAAHPQHFVQVNVVATLEGEGWGGGFLSDWFECLGLGPSCQLTPLQTHINTHTLPGRPTPTPPPPRTARLRPPNLAANQPCPRTAAPRSRRPPPGTRAPCPLPGGPAGWRWTPAGGGGACRGRGRRSGCAERGRSIGGLGRNEGIGNGRVAPCRAAVARPRAPTPSGWGLSPPLPAGRRGQWV